MSLKVLKGGLKHVGSDPTHVWLGVSPTELSETYFCINLHQVGLQPKPGETLRQSKNVFPGEQILIFPLLTEASKETPSGCNE